MTLTSQERSRQARRVTWLGALVDGVLGLAKLIIGTLFHSQGLIADGIHSLSDLATDFMVVLVMGFSGEAPDEDHPYGHERFETLGTVLLGSLLVAVAGAMAYHSALGLLENDSALTAPGWPALLVAVLSILSKEWIFRYTRQVGERLGSDLLIANAWHSRTDALSSAVVFVGIAGGMAGLPWLDSLAALVVAGFVARIGWNLSWKSLKELVDTAIPAGQLKDIKSLALSVEGVRDVHSFKSRRMGSKILLEMHLQVDPYLSVSEGHYIGDSVVHKLLREFGEIGHVIFHIDCEDDAEENVCLILPLRSEITALLDEIIAQSDLGLVRERLVLHYLKGHIELELRLRTEDNRQEASSTDLEQLYHLMLPRLREESWFNGLTLYRRAC